jgi:hypothetical protein
MPFGSPRIENPRDGQMNQRRLASTSQRRSARSEGKPQLRRPPIRASSAVTIDSLIIHPNRKPSRVGCPMISSTNAPTGESV